VSVDGNTPLDSGFLVAESLASDFISTEGDGRGMKGLTLSFRLLWI